jgi:hypothetical protein
MLCAKSYQISTCKDFEGLSHSQYNHKLFLTNFLARRDDCPESYCHDPGVGVGVTPQGKNFNLGYIF